MIIGGDDVVGDGVDDLGNEHVHGSIDTGGGDDVNGLGGDHFGDDIDDCGFVGFDVVHYDDVSVVGGHDQ